MAAKRTTSQQLEPSSLDDWKASRYALATLPSGKTVRIRSVTLDELAADEALPDDLVRVAVLEMLPGGAIAEMARESVLGTEGAERSRSMARDLLSLRDKMVVRAVVDPVLSEADLADIDHHDKAMISDLSCRQTDLDATGRRVWGVEPLSTFATFREKHGCPPGCEACEQAVVELSQVQ